MGNKWWEAAFVGQNTLIFFFLAQVCVCVLPLLKRKKERKNNQASSYARSHMQLFWNNMNDGFKLWSFFNRFYCVIANSWKVSVYSGGNIIILLHCQNNEAKLSNLCVIMKGRDRKRKSEKGKTSVCLYLRSWRFPSLALISQAVYCCFHFSKIQSVFVGVKGRKQMLPKHLPHNRDLVWGFSHGSLLTRELLWLTTAFLKSAEHHADYQHTTGYEGEHQ